MGELVPLVESYGVNVRVNNATTIVKNVYTTSIGVNGATVDIYDGLTSAGPKIWSSGAMGAKTDPFPVNFNTGEQFQTGLYVVKSGANCNTKVFYE